MSTTPSPMVLRRRIAGILRSYRKEMGLSIKAASALVDRTQGWLSRIENSEVNIHPMSVRALLTEYHCPAEEINDWVELSREANQSDWWEADDYKKVISEDYQQFFGLEAGASHFYIYDVEIVTGLLQTADYSRALFEANVPADRAESIGTLVELRRDRQRILDKPTPPKVELVLAEAALRHRIGGAAVMKAQLEHLVRSTKKPHVDVRVVPAEAEANGVVGTAFTVMEFPEVQDPPLAFSEGITSNFYLRGADEVQRHKLKFERLQKAALNQKASAELIRKVMESLT